MLISDITFSQMHMFQVNTQIIQMFPKLVFNVLNIVLIITQNGLFFTL